jgi:hypothetical protein
MEKSIDIDFIYSLKSSYSLNNYDSQIEKE